MNRKYIFRIAKKKDIKSIMLFIKNNWDYNHILAKNYKYFCYEYLDKEKVNFFLAINNVDKKIKAIQGFIPYNKNYNHICGSITSVKKSEKTPYLGIETMIKMLSYTKPDTYCGIGTNPKTMVPLVERFLKRFVGKMDHFYILNKNVKKFKISKIYNLYKIRYYKSNNYNFKLYKIDNFEILSKQFNLNKTFLNLPKKDKNYIKKRYFEHPIYNYSCYGIFNKNKKCKSILITREVFLKKTKILRIVDFRGQIEYLSLIKNSLIKLLTQNKYEYLDMISCGIPNKVTTKLGFKKKDLKDKNIIPNYFDPFIQKNVEIWYEKSHKNLILFKGDADSDRPRLNLPIN